MTTNIIKFPTEGRQRARLRAQMNELITAMDDMYSEIDDSMAVLCALEDQVAKIEETYNAVLKSYAQATTTTELEARYLAYCSTADVHWDGDKNALIFMLPPIEEEEDPS